MAKTLRTGLSRAMSSPADHILFLQRAIGNQAVQRIFESSVLQAKLKIGKLNDVHELEADRVANQVMRMPETAVSDQPTALSGKNGSKGEFVRLRTADCKPKRDYLQMKPG